MTRKSAVDKLLNAPDQLAEMVDQGLSLSRMDFLYDQLKLVGAVMGLRALVEVVTFGENETARVAAARILTTLDEDPEQISERLKSAPFADLSMDQLEHVIDRLTGGDTDLTKLISEAKLIHTDTEAQDGQEPQREPAS